jgi:hypothetical protein
MANQPRTLLTAFESPEEDVYRALAVELPPAMPLIAGDKLDASYKDSLNARGNRSPVCAGEKAPIVREVRMGISAKVAWAITPNYKHLDNQKDPFPPSWIPPANLHRINDCDQSRAKVDGPPAQSGQVLPDRR